ncbi:hypothetical protein ACP70R_018344 [Stipagrostis hirtigluma subsp. patula]
MLSAESLVYKTIIEIREVVTPAQERVNGAEEIISTLYSLGAFDLRLSLSCIKYRANLFHHQIGLRFLQGSKATPTSDATTQTTHADESEFVHPGNMGFVLNDYPTSGANSHHSSYPGGNR